MREPSDNQSLPPGRMNLNGYLDANDGRFIHGWACDFDTPGRAVEVEVRLSTGYTGLALANSFRDDLRRNGVGDGTHAFTFELPPSAAYDDRVSVTAYIRGTDFQLKGGPMPVHRRRLVDLVAGDIVNNCNLRCPFCMVDYTNIHGLKLMTPETFSRAVQLLPEVPRGGFWLSCLHEPSLHPKFLDLVESVPPALRSALSFTTNLSRRMPDELMQRLADSGVGGIRISFDSRQPEHFEELRKGAKFANFQDNLARLVRHLRNSKNRPRLHFITMAFRTNCGEIPDLVAYCRDEIGAESHEVRYIYYVPHVAHWGKDRVLTTDEWAQLERSLEPLAARTELVLCGPKAGVIEQFQEEEGLKDYIARETAFGGSEDSLDTDPPDPVAIGRQLPDEPLHLRLRWDGLMMLEQHPDFFFKVNINRLSDPRGYFEAMRLAATR